MTNDPQDRAEDDHVAEQLEAERLAADVCIRTGPFGEPCAQNYDHTGPCDWLAADDMPADVRFVSWDWREQPDVIAIMNTAFTVRAAYGDVYTAMVDTRSDEYAVCISARPLDDVEIGRLYTRWLEAGDE